MSVIRRLFEDGTSEILPNMGHANVGDVVRVEDDASPEMGSWVWHELTATEPMNELSITEKSQDYASRYQGVEPQSFGNEDISIRFEQSSDKRIFVYATDASLRPVLFRDGKQTEDQRLIELAIWLEDEQANIYGAVVNPLDDVRVYYRILPTGKVELGMFGYFIDPTAGYLSELETVPSYVLEAMSERIIKKINNPKIML